LLGEMPAPVAVGSLIPKSTDGSVTVRLLGEPVAIPHPIYG
jgi:hypothetical protein